MPRSPSTDDYLFVGTGGRVLALAKSDGKTLWSTSLPRTGYQVVVMLVEDDTLFCATAGRAFALDPHNGRILWDNGLPGAGQGVTALCTARQPSDPASAAAAQQAMNQASQAASS